EAHILLHDESPEVIDSSLDWSLRSNEVIDEWLSSDEIGVNVIPCFPIVQFDSSRVDAENVLVSVLRGVRFVSCDMEGYDVV
ncbi:hypothetical protein PMAYCL1PPCAC_30112, partial [Pristionchus mayeri]